MTFDEAIKELDGCAFIGTSPELVELSDALYIIKQLRQEYAPKVEITKDQFNKLNGIVHTVDEEFEENELPDDGSVKITDKMIELEDGFVLLKDLNVIIHPETIKVVDE